jgi:hypothetical protein
MGLVESDLVRKRCRGAQERYFERRHSFINGAAFEILIMPRVQSLA